MLRFRECLYFVFAVGCANQKVGPVPAVDSTTEVEAPVKAAVVVPLKSPSDFAHIADKAARSAAIFGEAARVIMHPRCLNCHPNDDTPRQGMNFSPHDPPVTRGNNDRGVVAMECESCHQSANQSLTRVPGAPGWHLAPREMAWMGKSSREICEQMKDPKRNGGKTFAQLIEHNAHDKLVAWGWQPGGGREPVPGTQAEFGALIEAWIETGAACPAEEKRP